MQILEVNRTRAKAVRHQPQRLRPRPDVLARGLAAEYAGVAVEPAESAAVQPEHDHAGHQHGRLLSRACRRRWSSFLEPIRARKQLAKPQLRGAEGTGADAEPRRPDSDGLDRVRRRGGRRLRQHSAVVLHVQGRRRQPGDDAARDLRRARSSSTSPSRAATSVRNVSVAGQDVPSFGSRRVHTRLRLREGESNLLAGLLRDEQRQRADGAARHHARSRPALALRIDRRTDPADRHRHAADAAHRPDARADGRRSRADLHRHDAEPRARRAAAAHPGADRG